MTRRELEWQLPKQQARMRAIITQLSRASEPTLQRVETELGLTPRPESPDAGRPMTPVSERGVHE